MTAILKSLMELRSWMQAVKETGSDVVRAKAIYAIEDIAMANRGNAAGVLAEKALRTLTSY